jgi:hypothetical protein
MVNQALETSHLASSRALCLRASVAASSSIFRTLFQVPYPATPLFATLTQTAGVCTNNSHSGTSPSLRQPSREHQSQQVLPLCPYPSISLLPLSIPFPTPYLLSTSFSGYPG